MEGSAGRYGHKPTPLQGVTVTCSGGCLTTTATTAVDGTYSFMNVPNGAAYSLTFTDTGYVTQTITGVTVTGPATTNESPELVSDGGIGGTVTDASLTPLQGVTVTCSGGCPTTTATTAVDGTYSFMNVPNGAAYSLTFTDPGYGTLIINNVAVAGPAVTNNAASRRVAASWAW